MGSKLIHFADAALAQLVEHRIRNAGARGSNPLSGTIFLFLTLSLSVLVDDRYDVFVCVFYVDCARLAEIPA